METGHQRIAIDLIEMNTGQIAGLPSNPRQWTKAQLDELKASIEETPELLEARGCIVDYHEGKYVCLGGNMRYAACKALGMSELPCYVVPEGTTILKKKQIVAKDNVSMGEWDFDALANEWSDMDLEGWGVPIPPEWQDRIKEAEEKAKEDDFDEEKEEIPARCAKCDLWQLGEHTLMCGDSTSEEDVRKLMGDGGIKADLMLTDPPYNVNITNSQGMTIQNDNMAQGDFRKFLSGAMNNAANALKPGGAFYIWYSHSEELNFREAVAKTGSLEVKQTLIWNKNSFTFGRQDYKWKHEPCLYGWKQGAGHWFRDEFNHPTVIEDNVDIDKLKKDELKEMLKNMLASPVSTDVIDADKPLKNDLHPTMKPLQLCGQLIHNSTRPGQIVLDLFGGSGSTMMACEQLGRKNYTMEFDPHYCDVILARWEKLTGKHAVKIE